MGLNSVVTTTSTMTTLEAYHDYIRYMNAAPVVFVTYNQLEPHEMQSIDDAIHLPVVYYHSELVTATSESSLGTVRYNVTYGILSDRVQYIVDHLPSPNRLLNGRAQYGFFLSKSYDIHQWLTKTFEWKRDYYNDQDADSTQAATNHVWQTKDGHLVGTFNFQ